MGYCASVEMNVKVRDVAGALKAINEMMQPEVVQANGGGGNSRGEKWYKFVKNPPNNKFKTFEQAIKEWNYDGSMEDNGEFTIDCFDGEKIGDEDQLWAKIGQFCDGEIVHRGEDGAQWKYEFVYGQPMKEKKGKVSWE